MLGLYTTALLLFQLFWLSLFKTNVNVGKVPLTCFNTSQQYGRHRVNERFTTELVAGWSIEFFKNISVNRATRLDSFDRELGDDCPDIFTIPVGAINDTSNETKNNVTEKKHSSSELIRQSYYLFDHDL